MSDKPGLFSYSLLGSGVPHPTPNDPMPTLEAWLEDARRSGAYADPDSMALATATRDGCPSVRIVLCKAIEPASGSVVFYTSYLSRKGRELTANPRAAVVFHWPHAQRQARVEGTVSRLPEAESDAYFRSRSLLSRIGATVSRQSEPIGSRGELVAAAMAVAKQAALTGQIPRPEHWGGYRLSATSVELWAAGRGRLHDRLRWTRADSEAHSSWRVERLCP